MIIWCHLCKSIYAHSISIYKWFFHAVPDELGTGTDDLLYLLSRGHLRPCGSNRNLRRLLVEVEICFDEQPLGVVCVGACFLACFSGDSSSSLVCLYLDVWPLACSGYTSAFCFVKSFNSFDSSLYLWDLFPCFLVALFATTVTTAIQSRSES